MNNQAFNTYVRTAHLQHSAALGALIGNLLIDAWLGARRAIRQAPGNSESPPVVVRVSEQLRWAFARFNSDPGRGPARGDQGVPAKAVRAGVSDPI